MINLQNIDNQLFQDLAEIIEQGKKQVAFQANSTLTLTYWHVGKRINKDVLQNQRAEYGKQIVKTVALQLESEYGRSFTLRNLRRMMQFADEFQNIEIVTPLVTQLGSLYKIVLVFNILVYLQLNNKHTIRMQKKLNYFVPTKIVVVSEN